MYDAFRGKRVLVTGDTGFKGSWLSLWLTELGADVTGYALPAEGGQPLFDLLGLGRMIRHVDGDVRELEESIALDRYKWHDIDVVVDRIVVPAAKDAEADSTRQRISDSVEQALKLGEGIMQLAPLEGAEQTFSEHYACPNPDHPPYSVGEIEPRNFSFNSPHGDCPTCTGLGVQMEIDEGLVVPNRRLSINEGAIVPYQRISTSQHWYRRRIGAVGDAAGPLFPTPPIAVEVLSLDLMAGL